MSNAQVHLLSTTLLALFSCIGSRVVQYVTLPFFASYSALLLARPLLPSSRMNKLEKLLAESTDLLQRANEEDMLFNREFNLANLTQSTLRSRLLKFGTTQEYLHMLGFLSQEIEQCKREAKDIQTTILSEMEKGRQLVYNEEISILSSGFALKLRKVRD
ncbi:hypothetical protein C8R44DRAFT_263787 [Mycena epipterygia]|nr:hypothetical protein C8R44DRAFT_263787 [Mycena epipterygia]